MNAPLSPGDLARDIIIRAELERNSNSYLRRNVKGGTERQARASLSRRANSSRPAASSTSTPGLSLLVKPFVNLSPTPDAGVFAAGLSEEMLSQLATFQGLTIVRSEASDDLAQRSSAARRQLGARHILEGMIRAADNKLRITSRLVDGETAAIRWSAIYEADLHSGNIIDLESGVAQKIAAAVAQAIKPPLHASSKVP